MSFSLRIHVLVLLIALTAVGCRKANQPQRSSVALPIAEVLAGTKSYSHRLITVSGCYVEAYERTTIQPCDSKRHEDVVWLDNAESLPMYNRNFTPDELVPKALQAPPTTPPEFVFRYDKSKIRTAWAILTRIAPNGGEVVVTGQFDTVAHEKMKDESRGFGPGFGHLGQYQHRLILVDVLDSERTEINSTQLTKECAVKGTGLQRLQLHCPPVCTGTPARRDPR